MDSLRSFVNVKEVSDSVACAVEVAEPVLPKVDSCKRVKLRSSCTLRVNRLSECDVSLHDKGEVAFLLRSGVAEGYCSCYVCSSVEIACSGVYEQKVFRLDDDIGLWIR